MKRRPSVERLDLHAEATRAGEAIRKASLNGDSQHLPPKPARHSRPPTQATTLSKRIAYAERTLATMRKHLAQWYADELDKAKKKPKRKVHK